MVSISNLVGAGWGATISSIDPEYRKSDVNYHTCEETLQHITSQINPGTVQPISRRSLHDITLYSVIVNQQNYIRLRILLFNLIKEHRHWTLDDRCTNLEYSSNQNIPLII